MNLKLRDEAAFHAEYQNQPLVAELNVDDLTADQIASRINMLERYTAPIRVEHISMFIDIQATLLYYVVVGWEPDFSGYLLDYGEWPSQQRAYFTLRDARRTLSMVTGITGLEGSIYAGLEALTNDLLNREWPREDGAVMRIGKCLIDANWGNSTDIVYEFCRQSTYAGLLVPSHGRFVGASGIPFSEYKRKPGEQVGHNWRLPSIHGKRAIRHVIYDANYWKSFVYARLAVAMGDPGGLSLFGKRPETHRLFIEHLLSEYRVKTEGRGRVVDEWKLRPERSDNHWWDGLVGCAVGGSMLGASLPGTQVTPIRRTVTRTPAEWAALARGKNL